MTPASQAAGARFNSAKDNYWPLLGLSGFSGIGIDAPQTVRPVLHTTFPPRDYKVNSNVYQFLWFGMFSDNPNIRVRFMILTDFFFVYLQPFGYEIHKRNNTKLSGTQSFTPSSYQQHQQF